MGGKEAAFLWDTCPEAEWSGLEPMIMPSCSLLLFKSPFLSPSSLLPSLCLEGSKKKADKRLRTDPGEVEHYMMALMNCFTLWWKFLILVSINSLVFLLFLPKPWRLTLRAFWSYFILFSTIYPKLLVAGGLCHVLDLHYHCMSLTVT